jgi:hypothetical protein
MLPFFWMILRVTTRSPEQLIKWAFSSADGMDGDDYRNKTPIAETHRDQPDKIISAQVRPCVV